MRKLRKFLNLTTGDRLLLVLATLWLGVIRVGLWLLPFQTLQRLLARVSKPTSLSSEVDEAFISRASWAVKVATRYIPGTRCLANALAAQVLLERRGYPAQLRIGVMRLSGGPMSAHAWLESQGRVVIGGEGSMAQYLVLPIQEEEGCVPNRWHLFS